MKLYRWILGALVLAVAPLSGQPAADPLAREIARLSAVAAESRPGELWGQVKPASEAALTEARQALDAGRRFAALDRLAGARTNLAAAMYVIDHPAAVKDLPSFEAEWKRMGQVLAPDLPASPGAALNAVRPAALRAVGEAALSQVRAYYEAGLEYGRNTTPDSGLFYVGAASAQQELVAFARGAALGSAGTAPGVRGIGPELEALETELLAAYRPPRSIERHREFIAASAAIKEARELDRKGLHYGALYRYLQASLRVATIAAAPGAAGAAPADRLREQAARLTGGQVDHTLGRLFLELGQMALDGAQPNPDRAGIVAGVVLPRYFAAIEPARPASPPAAPAVTITLVRWPFT